MMEKLFLITVLLVLFKLPSFVTPDYVPAIFAFGDSILDAGNNRFIKNCTAQANFPPYGSTYFHHPTGRFTNGRTVADLISQYIGIDFQEPYLEAHLDVVNGSIKSYPNNGINFASAGSGVFPQTNQDEHVMPMQVQLQQFQTLVQQGQIDTTLIQNSLFLFESGSNDIFGYFFAAGSGAVQELPRPHDFVKAMLDQVESFVDEIYNLGARRIALFSLGPVGCVPARALLKDAPLDRCYGKLNFMVERYNHGLLKMVRHARWKYPDAVIAYGDVYGMVRHFRSHPYRNGFLDVTNACCGAGQLGGEMQCGIGPYKVCQNPDEFMFWDLFHPTEHTYQLIAESLWDGDRLQIKPVNLRTLADKDLFNH
ncbi:hypothetical protein I3760_05G242600 [Carya illinoinensis]|uniref:GDSL esterase/lipase 6 n=1 Tax=Carya illinoinensis TaxID=32201 RepID=A0A8T1QN15_CARIL|nr:GDSL esterase/lipase 6 [Carya illinoinensis]KAG2709499.1 hypothetical protein I3760_05G242600 [Carya illinoinensis]KAG6655877.1 hypothetical protein CIPAW_05G246700 [Carya illinoinensis]KAG6715194.1 hypothetical protein I3842_05G239000 [Carya illinoinensis]